MLTVSLAGLGLVAPGLTGWEAAREVLAGRAPYRSQPLPGLSPALLPPNERRRTSATTRLALEAARQALEGWDGPKPLTVFASSGGDYDIFHQICTALARGEPVSPTQFHNSVHNAPAGYFAIGSRCQSAATALAAFDGSFAAGLLEAATQTVTTGQPALLVAYDQPPPPPLLHCRPLTAPYGVALLLTPQPGVAPLAGLSLTTTRDQPETTLADPDLETLRRGNPAARSLALLGALVESAAGDVILPWLDDLQLRVEVRP